MDQKEVNYFAQMEAELEKAKLESAGQQRDLGQISMFGGGNDDNLIKWQLDLNEDLERVDHLLRGHTLKYNKKGDMYWASPEDDNLTPFNDYGVDMLMKIISFYLNRNTILSNFSEEMINWKIKDLGDEVADLIFMEYEAMGMDTPDKKKQYPIIVREIIDTIHSAYLRGLKGGERESLRRTMHVSQNENPAINMMRQQSIAPQGRRSVMKPWTWNKG